jgi:O-antigen/teichoic acid export membrane protein
LFNYIKISNTIQKGLKNSFVTSSFVVLLTRVLGILIGYITLLILTNYFTEELVGQYNYLESILVVIGAITLLGMNESFLQFSGKFEAQDTSYLLKSLYKKKIIILLLTSASLILSYFFVIKPLFCDYIVDNHLEEIWDKALMAVFFYSLSLLNFKVIRALDKLYLSEIFKNLFRYLFFFFGVLIIYFCNAIELLLTVYVISFILLATLSSLVIIVKFRRDFFITKKVKGNETNSVSFKHIVKISYPMTISYLSLLVMQSTDVFILKAYFDYNVIAYYGIVIKLSMLTAIVLTSINAIIAPKISKLYYSNNILELKTVINKSILINLIFTLPIIFSLLLFPKFILNFFGENYSKASVVLIIVLLGQFINAFSGSVGIYLNMTGRQKIFQQIVLIAVSINLILNLVLIPKYGMIGAALATSFSLSFWNIAGVIWVYRNDDILLVLNKKTLFYLTQLKK